MEDNNLIGKRIVQLRKRRGMSQAELAQKAGKDRSGLSFVERGIHLPHPTTIAAIAEALGVLPEALTDPDWGESRERGRGSLTIGDLLHFAGIEDNPLGMESPADFNALFSNDLSFEETYSLAQSIVRAHRAVERVLDYQLRDASPGEAAHLRALRARAAQFKVYALFSAMAARDREVEAARERGDEARASQLMKQWQQLDQAS